MIDCELGAAKTWRALSRLYRDAKSMVVCMTTACKTMSTPPSPPMLDGELWKVDEDDMKSFNAVDSSGETKMAIPPDRWVATDGEIRRGYELGSLRYEQEC